MSQWKDLPNEIVQQIAEKLDKDWTTKEKWMFVNKQLHGIYQSYMFEEICLHELDPYKEELFQEIASSPFSPG